MRTADNDGFAIIRERFKHVPEPTRFWNKVGVQEDNNFVGRETETKILLLIIVEAIWRRHDSEVAQPAAWPTRIGNQGNNIVFMRLGRVETSDRLRRSRKGILETPKLRIEGRQPRQYAV